MIDRNLGNAERIVRLFFGIVFGGWALSQPALNGVEWLRAVRDERRDF